MTTKNAYRFTNFEGPATNGTLQSAHVRIHTNDCIMQADFISTACAQLQADTFVCVGVPGASTTTPTPTTTTKPSSQPTPPAQIEKPCRWIPSKGQYQCPGEWPPAPGPTQAGIPPCTKWVLQKNGVYCADMAKAAGITLAQFYTWNPAVGTNCGGLWAGYAYCVGVN